MAQDIETFMDKLDYFSNRAFDESEKYRADEMDNGLAYDYLGRVVSCFMGVKTLLFALNHAGTTQDFAAKYIAALPERFPRKDIRMAERYLKETHMAIRFVLFQNFYSQTESTFRIIQRAKHPAEHRRNPFKLIAEEYGILNGNVPEFLNDIRNTIHNNGHYFPSDNQDKQHTFLGKTFKFEQAKPIMEVTMTDILTIVEYMLEETITLFRNNEELATLE